MSQIRDIYIIHHSHTDIGYTNYQDTVFALHREYLRRAIDLAERYAGNEPGEQFKWTSETTVVTEDFLRHASASEIDRLLALAQRGLVDFGGMYCNWTPLATTEILAQSLMVAARLRKDYGLDIRFGMNCDVNGQSWGLVELLLDAGFGGFSMAINRVMARDPQPRPRGFRWQGPGGRSLLVWHGEHYGYGHRLGIPRIQRSSGWTYDVEAARGRVQQYINGLVENGYPHDFVQFQITSTFMWDNGGPHEDLVRFVQDWNQRGWEPRMQLVGLSDVFARLDSQGHLETLAGDWTDWWSHGVASSAFETALTRQSHRRLAAAQSLSALLQGQPNPQVYAHDEDEIAWRGLALYDEHTWGSGDSLHHASSPASRGQWHRKALYAYEGEAAVGRLVQKAHQNLSARLAQSETPMVVVWNPLPWARRVPLLLPAVVPNGWQAAQFERNLEHAAPQSDTAARVDYGIVDLPAAGYITLPLRLEPEEPPPIYPTAEKDAVVRAPWLTPKVASGLTPTEGVVIDGWTLENQFYRLVVHPVSGAIRSLTERVSGKEWVDQSTPWGIGEYIYETNQSPRQWQDVQVQFTPPGRTPDFDRQRDLMPQRTRPEQVTSIEAIQGVGQSRLHLTLKAAGVDDLHVQIILYDDLPWIDLIYDLKKTAAAQMESVYIAFPFALRQPKCHYEASGAVVEAETEQLPYGSRDFYSIQNWVDLSDAQGGMTVAALDAPIIHLGGFTNHKYLAQMQMEQPFLIGWPVNNHWFTNFQVAQEGWMRFRYRLMPHETPFDPAAATRFGLEAAVEPLCGPLWDRPAGLESRVFSFAPHLPEQASLLTLESAHVQLIGLKPAADGQGVICRLQELSGQESDFSLRFNLSRVAGAEVCDITERPLDERGLTVTESSISGRIGAHRLQTIQIAFKV